MHRSHGISSATRWLSLLGALLWFGLTAHAQPTAQRYLIEFRDFGSAVALVRSAGGSPVHEFPAHRTIAAWLPEQARLALANRPEILRIERDAERYPLAQTTPRIATPSGPTQMARSDGPRGPSRRGCSCALRWLR